MRCVGVHVVCMCVGGVYVVCMWCVCGVYVVCMWCVCGVWVCMWCVGVYLVCSRVFGCMVYSGFIQRCVRSVLVYLYMDDTSHYTRK